jgi:hypothetical protein
VHKLLSIEEILVEIILRSIAGNRNLFGQKISPASVANSFTIAMNGEVGAVNLLRSHPKNVGVVESFFLDCVDEFVPGGGFK